METINYNGQTIKPIMKPMLCWDDDESKARKYFVLAECSDLLYKFITSGKGVGGGRGFKNAKYIPKIEIIIKINGRKAKLSDISDETIKRLKELE